MIDKNKVFSSCVMCQGGKCGIEVTIEDEKATKINGNKLHPFNEGRLCPKGLAGLEQLYDPDRLLIPKQKVAKDKWQKITWDDALQLITKNMQEIKRKYGAESFLFMWGPTPPYKELFQGLAKSYGTPNQFAHTSICDANRRLAKKLTYNDYRPLPDFKNSDYILLFGANPLEAHKWFYFYKDVKGALKRGAKLVVIDPRQTKSAKNADLWLSIKPGTDGALALSLAHIIIKEELYNKEFINKYSRGFASFKAEVMQEKYNPENVSQITGINTKIIYTIARQFAKSKQQLADSWTGLDNQKQGINAHRAVACLNALVGSVDALGGMVFREEGRLKSPEFTNNIKAKPLHEEVGFSNLTAGYGCRGLIPEAILTPDHVPTGPLLEKEITSLYKGQGIKGAFIYFTNPILADANSERWRKALGNLDFAVGYDIYQTDTLEAFPVGSIILPDTTYLERSEVVKQYSNGALLTMYQKVVEPKGEAKSGYWTFVKLGKLLGFDSFQNFDEGDIESYLKMRLDIEQVDGSQVQLEELKRKGIWLANNFDEPKYYRYDQLLNGKFNFALDLDMESDLVKEFLRVGGNQTPIYKLQESNNKLKLITTGKLRCHTHSTTQNLPALMARKGKNSLLINPEDAKKREIRDGEKVIVNSEIDTVRLTAKVTNEIREGVVQSSHGFGHTSEKLRIAKGQGANINRLVDNLKLDPISGVSYLNEMEVVIKPI
ncbi:molybdopterin-containing oxidoreductase family protein [Selenihalanaerobacter shriftii]|uniref:Thiosulfate reductase / polysulfide reductase chain A n=1 Tax=Selenihalanaerobacter shriftii TaxID=142842 RepID=A0A1T4PEP1_9FIRM|nr:molybdopterin-dependent oxidoreductase [Selenihalanaerobacter shriftii]SJZ89949.1 thiosulfate reductase / polysulfide reductase chain A [Selenihalanaerobacter shriftii]